MAHYPSRRKRILELFLLNKSRPNKTHKRGARRVRLNKSPRSDAITLRGSLLNQQILLDGTGSLVQPTGGFLVNPGTLGDRPLTAGTMFLRYRIKSLVFQIRSVLNFTMDGDHAFGVADDTEVTTAIITTPIQIIALRVSRMIRTNQSLNLRWSPIDKSKWYYVNSEAGTAADRRFQSPCCFNFLTTNAVKYWPTNVAPPGPSSPIFLQNNTVAYTLDIHYVIEYEGATVIAV